MMFADFSALSDILMKISVDDLMIRENLDTIEPLRSQIMVISDDVFASPSAYPVDWAVGIRNWSVSP